MEYLWQRHIFSENFFGGTFDCRIIIHYFGKFWDIFQTLSCLEPPSTVQYSSKGKQISRWLYILVLGNEHHISSSSKLEPNEQNLFTRLSSMSSSQAFHHNSVFGFFLNCEGNEVFCESNGLYLWTADRFFYVLDECRIH